MTQFNKTIIVNLSKQEIEILEEIKKELSCTRSQAIRTAINIYAIERFMQKLRKEDDNM